MPQSEWWRLVQGNETVNLRALLREVCVSFTKVFLAKILFLFQVSSVINPETNCRKVLTATSTTLSLYQNILQRAKSTKRKFRKNNNTNSKRKRNPYLIAMFVAFAKGMNCITYVAW